MNDLYMRALLDRGMSFIGNLSLRDLMAEKPLANWVRNQLSWIPEFVKIVPRYETEARGVIKEPLIFGVELLPMYMHFGAEKERLDREENSSMQFRKGSRRCSSPIKRMSSAKKMMRTSGWESDSIWDSIGSKRAAGLI